jgi:PhoH-like ATPase
MNKCKIFVIDTNVILHDHESIYHFMEHDVVIPITVLEELDKFKRGNDPLNFEARQFVRILDDIVGPELFNGGISLGEGKGHLTIETGKPFSENLKDSFREDTPDHRILAISEFIKDKYPDRKVILVTKDVNLRMKAKSLQIDAEDYKTDKVADISFLDLGVREYKDFDDNLIAKLYEQGHLTIEEMGIDPQPFANEFFIIKSSKSSILACYNPFLQRMEKVDKKVAYGIKPHNAEQTFSVHALLDPDVKLVSLTGKAGTGKTLLALACAIAQHKMYEQVLLARPIVSLSNRDIGFLPGDVGEKINPYMQPLFDNLSVIKRCFNPHSQEHRLIEELQEEERLVISPLAFIRGRSVSNCYFIIDEAQNLTPHEVKTIITRAGEGTKMVFTGDIEQIDSPYLDTASNGLSYLSDKMKNQDIFAHVNLIKGERSFLAELASKLL